MQSARVTVLGSANMDLVVHTDRFPLPGETILRGSFSTFPGGKGANQAVAIGRLGGNPRFIGKVGDDAYGVELRSSLEAADVDTTPLLTSPTLPTGVALITVDAHGENTIIVASGANMELKEEEVLSALGESSTNVLLCQLEIPLDSILAAAKAHRGMFILNPAPAQPLSDELLSLIDVITPNQTEAQILTGVMPIDQASCREASEALLERGVQQIVITMGAEGCYLRTSNLQEWLPAFEVQTVDTTAAGDAFSGALSLGLAQGKTLLEAARFASAVAALSTTRHGAQASMPSLTEVEAGPLPPD